MIGWFGSPRQREALRLRRSGVYVTYPTRCAARFAALTGCSIWDAARVFAINVGGVWNAWERMYPGVPHPKRCGL